VSRKIGDVNDNLPVEASVESEPTGVRTIEPQLTEQFVPRFERNTLQRTPGRVLSAYTLEGSLRVRRSSHGNVLDGSDVTGTGVLLG
jgi:hypothetical protein